MNLIFALFFIFTNAAFGSDDGICNYRNLYEDQGSVLNEIPIYDQSGLGTCYAYSAAQLVDFYLKKNGDPLSGSNVSPLWVAFNHKIHETFIKHVLTQTKTDSLEYSSIKWAIQDLSKHGICKEETIEHSVKTFSKNNHLSEAEYFFLLSRVWEARRKVANDDLQKMIVLISSDPDVQLLLKKIELRFHPKDEENSTDGRILTKIVKNIKNKIENKNKSNALLDFLKDNVFKDCNGDSVVRVSLPKVKDIGQFYASDEKLSSVIDTVLNANSAQPIAIGYCSKILNDESILIKRRKLFPRVLGIASQKSCSPHYSLVVGQKPSADNSHCDYLVRNSYGTGFWTKKYQCYCEDKDGTKRNCSAEQDGLNLDLKVLGCWINGNDLKSVTFDLAHF